MIEKLKVEPHVADLVIGHVSGVVTRGAAGVHNRANLIDARREALRKWADYVGRLA